MTKKKKTKITTPEFTACYSNVFEPRETLSGDSKYSISMVFKKSRDLTNLYKAAKNAAINKWGPDEKKWPKNLRSPFRDGDTDRPDDEVYQNSVFINASSKSKPGIVDTNLAPIINEAEFYSGVVARAALNFYAYNKAGNQGISAGLNNLLKISEGDHLGGSSKPEDDFADFKAENDEDNSSVSEFDLF